MTEDNAGGGAIWCNCLVDFEMRREDKMGEFGTKCGFRFSKALIADGDIS
jgi:hypothetical protein